MKKYIFLSILLALYSCSEKIEPGSIEASGVISGFVLDKTTGEPVDNVNVRLSPGGRSLVTGNDGSYAFYELSSGDYSLSFHKEHYDPKTITTTVRDGHVTDLDVLLERKGAVLSVNPLTLEFGESINTLSFTIVNSGFSDIEYTIETGDCTWIHVDPASGILGYSKTATILVTLIRDQLKSGENSEHIIVRSSTGQGNAELLVTAVGEYRSTAKVNTLDVTDITDNSAKLNGEVTEVGGPAYNERGFIWGNEPNPTIDACLKSQSVAMTENKNFSLKVDGLEPNTTYYARAYVTIVR